MTKTEQKLACLENRSQNAGICATAPAYLRQDTVSKEDDIRLDQKVRAAWMYYIAGQNQSEIASHLGTSRPVVQRLIAAAKEEGIVSIGLHHPVANCLDYAQLLQEKYQLIECNIVPTYNEESTLDSVSFGCYQLMARYLQSDNAKIIGIGSGLTLKTIQRIDFDSPNSRCVALISAMNDEGNATTTMMCRCCWRGKFRPTTISGPRRYAQTRQEHEMWCGSRLFSNVSAAAQQADVIFVGIGPLGTQSPIFKDGFINKVQLDELTARGGIGEILGRFIDADGGVVDSEINRLITSYDIRQNQCPRIAVACGENKRPAILAALKGGWINGR